MWVLKPSDLAEGEGISIGSSLSPSSWKESLQHASKNAHKWILQEKVTLPEETFTIMENGVTTSKKAYYDFCPHVFLLGDAITFGNTLVRFSEAEIVNVMKGGGISYLFEEK